MQLPRLFSTVSLAVCMVGGIATVATAEPTPSSSQAQASECSSILAGGAEPSGSRVSEAPAVEDARRDETEVRLEPLLWLPTADASVSVGDARFQRTLSVSGSVTPSETLPNLHVSFTGRLEGRSGRWGGFGEYFYLSSSQPATVLGSGGTLSTRLSLGQVSGFYRLNEGKVPVDLVAGVRVAGLSNNLDFSSSKYAVLGGQGFNVTRSNTNLYPLLGARVGFPLGKDLTLQVYGDYGGFGIGHNQQTWRAQGVLGYDVNDRMRLVLGYTAVNFSGSRGNGVTEYRLNSTFHGPVLGASFKL